MSQKLRSYKAAGKIIAARTSGISAINDASYQIAYVGNPQKESLKGPLIVTISSKVSPEQAIKRLYAVIGFIKSRKKKGYSRKKPIIDLS